MAGIASLIVWEFCMKHPEIRDVSAPVLTAGLVSNQRGRRWYAPLSQISGLLLIRCIQCDLGQTLFFGWRYVDASAIVVPSPLYNTNSVRWTWYFTAVMFLLNNTFIQVSSGDRRVREEMADVSFRGFTFWLAQR